MSDRLFKFLVHAIFIFVAVYLYIAVVQLWAGKWRAYFMRSGNVMYYIYLILFTYIYVQIIKILWRWQVRALNGF